MITLTDRIEDGFPHGTIEGYHQGCKERSCRGGKALGITCLKAYTRYTSDWSFRKQITAGAVAAHIVAWEKAEAAKPKIKPAVVAVVRKAPRVKRDTYAPKTSRKAPVPEGQVIMPRKQFGRITTPASHGTAEGFRRGCRTDCPTEVTCADANRAYNRENYRKNQALKALA